MAQEGSTIDTQFGHERTTPDLVSVARGIMHCRGGQFSSDRRGADFSRHTLFLNFSCGMLESPPLMHSNCLCH